jgi:TatD DNase family protein
LEFLDSLKSIAKGRQEFKRPDFRVFSNSTDLGSSRRNLEIASVLPECVIPFVGIHPQAIVEKPSLRVTNDNSKQTITFLQQLVERAQGIGEIGLDETYGLEELQLDIFQKQLEIAESKPWLPLSLHSRNATARVAEILSTFHLRNRVLFHWFSGTEQELNKLESRGYYVSFGPALIFSKRLQALVKGANKSLILAETDSPLIFSSLLGSRPVTPFVVSSVIFKISEIRGESYDEMKFVTDQNAEGYIQAQN